MKWNKQDGVNVCSNCGWEEDDVKDDPKWHAEHCASVRPKGKKAKRGAMHPSGQRY